MSQTPQKFEIRDSVGKILRDKQYFMITENTTHDVLLGMLWLKKQNTNRFRKWNNQNMRREKCHKYTIRFIDRI
jgi:hypothetical protein